MKKIKKLLFKNVYKLKFCLLIFEVFQSHIGKCVFLIVIKYQKSKKKIKGYMKH